MRTHLESRDVYIGNVNTNESTYNFLIAQQDDTKKLIDVEFIVSDDYNFNVEEFLVGVTDDLVDMHSNSTSKFLFYHFNNSQLMMVEEVYKSRHTIIFDYQFALEKSQ